LWLLLFGGVFLTHTSHGMYSVAPNFARTDLSAVFNYPFNVYKIPGGDRYCPMQSGSMNCKSAIKCSPWFVELLYNPWWCYANDGSFGTCCPDVYSTASSVARFPDFAKLSAMPYDVSSYEMQKITDESAKYIVDIASYEKTEWDAMLAPWESSAAFSYSATTYAQRLAQQEGWKGLQSVESTRKLASMLNLSPKEAGFIPQNVAVNGTALSYICRSTPECISSPFRNYDGSCNNLEYPNWGRSNSGLERLLPPQYQDGIWAPRDWPGLPPVNEVSRTIADIDFPDHQLTITVMHWGQFVAHDLTHVPTFRALDGQAIKCCTPDGKYLSPERTHPLCFQIDVPNDHEFYSQHGVSCLDFVRSVIAPRDDCKFGFADQLNQNTAYLDASVIYGSTEETAESLREFFGGRMRVSVIDGSVLLPIDETRQDCVTFEPMKGCFVGGDQRVNQYTSLTALHTLFVRLHNRYAAHLSTINPHWDDERLYQETKRIVGALIQHITYNEYLPSVLGPYIMKEYGLLPLTAGYSFTYDPKVKTQVTNEFATAAFRYGHSLIRNFNELWLDDTYSVYGGELHLKDWFNNPTILLRGGLVDALIRHFITGTSQNFDYNVAEAVHQYLFKSPYQSWGLDLISANLWRARDHGIGGYNFYLEACGIKRAKDFDDLLDIIRPEVVEKFKLLYKSVDDIDLFIGLLGEWAVKGGLVGPVTSCIMADQFSRLRDGDRFFYENGGQPHSFTIEQLDSIRSMSLARIFCDTSDSVSWVTHNVFWTPSTMNPWLPCYANDIPQLDLNLWRETTY